MHECKPLQYPPFLGGSRVKIGNPEFLTYLSLNAFMSFRYTCLALEILELKIYISNVLF